MLAMRNRKFNPVNNATFRKVLELVRRYRSGLNAGKRVCLSQRATLGKTAKEACSRVLVTLETSDPNEAEGWLPGKNASR